jgi:polyphosphate kinase
MSTANETAPSTDLSNRQNYFSQELSWLEFNHRVLQEALDSRTPLLERLKFLAIFSSNLDEFFMVRISGLISQVNAEVTPQKPDDLTPQQKLAAITQRLRPSVARQHQLFERELRPLLEEKGVYLVNYIDLNKEQRLYLQQYFEESVFPILTPLAIDPSHPFPHMSNLSLNLAVSVKDPKTTKENFARVKVPSIVPRFIVLPESLRQYNGKSCLWLGIPLEQLIAHNLEKLFSGMAIQEFGFFRVTRDADLDVQEDEANDLLSLIEEELRKHRLGGSAVRLEVQMGMPDSLKDPLVEEFGLSHNDVYEIDGLLNLQDLFSFMGLPLPELKDAPWTAVVPTRLKAVNEYETEAAFRNKEAVVDIFSVIRQGDLLVHHPYESFTASVQRFIDQAAYDPHVLAIKMTLYRTSGDSPIVQSLIAAAENGKQVGVLVELKARFDEANNINWARSLEAAGVNIVHGVAGLKTHTKIVLVIRQEQGKLKRYAHIGTGNYNPKTAGLYTDLGLLTCREELGADLTDLTNFLTGYSRQSTYRKLLVAPANLRDRMVDLIERETDHARSGKTGRIIAKMNALVDIEMIKKLYEASQAGVEIDLIVRGMCCLRPGLKGISETIRVVSIIGRYLEHSRIFYFHNDGEEALYIGSADWMTRNLDRRVEAVTPIEDPHLKAELKSILDIFMADNRQAWDLHSNGEYIQRQPAKGEAVRSAQKSFMERALKAAT